MKIIKVGILGYGLSGKFFHSKVIKAVEGFDIVKIMTSSHKTEAKADFKNASIVSNADDIFNDTTIDLVIISTPNSSHFELASKAMYANKHVVIEKPFTITTHDVLLLMAIADETKQLITVYHNRRFDGDFRTLKDLINHDAVGRLVEFESHFDRFRNTFNNAWGEKDIPGSGILYDLGPHLIDQALYLFGLPHEVYADIHKQRRGEVDDAFEIIFYYLELKVILKAGMLVKEPLPRFVLNGTKGSYIKYGLDPQEAALISGEINADHWGYEPESMHGILNTDERKYIPTQPGDYRLYYQNIYNAIVHGETLEVTIQDAFNSIRIIEAIIHSNQEKKRIEIKH